MSSKKRRHDPETEERSLHQSFAAAANALTQFYVSAERENKRNKAEFARQMLERQFDWVLREYGNSANVPTAALLTYLQHEVQNIDALEAQHQPRLATPFFHIPEETVAAAQQQKEASFAFGAASMTHYKHPQEDPHHRFMR